jgi:hypothetical protein
VAIALLRRGSLRNLESFPLKSPFLFLLALVCKALVWAGVALFLPVAFRFGNYVYLASFLLVAAGLWQNRRPLEFRMAGVGLFSNLLCISLNGWRMPVSELGLPCLPPRLADTIRSGLNPQNVLLTEATRLKFLSDLFVLPSGAYSVGDVILTLAVFLFIQRTMCSTTRRSRVTA